jgi:hypothetical protein
MKKFSGRTLVSLSGSIDSGTKMLANRNLDKDYGCIIPLSHDACNKVPSTHNRGKGNVPNALVVNIILEEA